LRWKLKTVPFQFHKLQLVWRLHREVFFFLIKKNNIRWVHAYCQFHPTGNWKEEKNPKSKCGYLPRSRPLYCRRRTFHGQKARSDVLSCSYCFFHRTISFFNTRPGQMIAPRHLVSLLASSMGLRPATQETHDSICRDS